MHTGISITFRACQECHYLLLYWRKRIWYFFSFFYVVRRNHECGLRENNGEFAIALRTSINLDLAECMPIVFLGGSPTDFSGEGAGRGMGEGVCKSPPNGVFSWFFFQDESHTYLANTYYSIQWYRKYNSVRWGEEVASRKKHH